MAQFSFSIGELRHCIELYEDVGDTKDSRGHREEKWVKRGSLRAKIEYLSGQESTYYSQVQGSAVYRFTTRWTGALRPLITWQIRFARRTFHIVGVNNVDERNRYWMFTAVEQL